jgi:hypothetical protein
MIDNKNFNQGIFVNVLIKDKKFKIFCSDGRQKLRWLTDNAILKYQNMFSGRGGIAYGLKLENGDICNLNEKIVDIIKNNENVWILLKEEFDVFQENYEENY